MKEEKVVPQCECGCRRLVFDATAEWNTRLQKWIYNDLSGSDPYCPRCGDTVRRWEFVEASRKVKYRK